MSDTYSADPNSDLLSTPRGYATPGQVNEAALYGRNLLAGSLRDKPITHWAQGIRMMADALAGRSMVGQAASAQQRANDRSSSNRAGQLPTNTSTDTSPTPIPTQPPVGGPPPALSQPGSSGIGLPGYSQPQTPPSGGGIPGSPGMPLPGQKPQYIKDPNADVAMNSIMSNPFGDQPMPTLPLTMLS